MDRKDSSPFRPQAKNMLIPELRLRARVGENEGGRRGFDLGHHLFDHFGAKVTRPGKALRRFRQKRVDDQRLVEPTLDERSTWRVAGPEKHALRVLEVADGRRKTPGRNAGTKMTKASERKLCLHAALVADELVPFVDDDEGKRSERLPRALLREHEREAFRRGDEEARRLFRLGRALAARCVAGAGADPPQRRAVLGRDAGESLAQRSLRVGGERAHRRDPEHADCVIRIRSFARGEPGAERNRQRLARSRRRVEEPGSALRHEPPGLPLKRKDCPVSTSEPGLRPQRAIDRMRSRRALSAGRPDGPV